jgi:hypothetical protein
VVKRAEENLGNEEDVFERRAEWYRDMRGDRHGFIFQEGRREALEQASKIHKIRLRERDPGGLAPEGGFEIVGDNGRYKKTLRLYKAQNPRPKSSFGFASDPVEVRSTAKLFHAKLKISLNRSKIVEIDPSSVRIFRYDNLTGNWQLVAQSGPSVNGKYAWGSIRSSGIYVAIGLPSDPWLLQTIAVINSYMPWLQAARETQSLDQLLDHICKIILCDDVFKDVRNNPALTDKLDLPPLSEGSNARLQNICKRCFGLDLPDGGLPEGSILDDDYGVFQDIPPKFLFPWPFFCKRWIPNGPNNINGRIKSMTIHPYDGNIVYAGGADGGVWKTIDGGVSWYSTMQIELSMAIGALGIGANSPNVIYAATGEDTPGWAPSYPGVGVYKSTDGGGDWDLLPPITSTRCNRVLVHPSDSNIVYVAGNSGLHKSVNGGILWTNVRTDHISDAVIDPLSPNVIYAGVWNKGVYKTIDGGTTWTLLSNGLPTGTSAEWIKLAIGLNGSDGTAFLVAKMGLDSGQMYKSSNAGASWTAIPGTHQPVSYNEWTNMVAVDPNNQDVIFAGGVGVERSGNGGASFTGIGGTHSDHHALVFSPANSNICYMVTDGGVYKSTNNGNAWTLMSTGLTSTQLYSIGVAQTSPIIIGGGTQDQGIIKSDGSSVWADTGAGNEGGFFIVDPNNGNNIYVTPWSTNLRRSINGGTSWNTILNGLGTPPPSVTHLAVQPGNSNTLLCTGANKVFRSIDQGNNWIPVLTTTGNTTYVVFSPISSSTCYAATRSGQIYRSTAGGTPGTWIEPYAQADKPPFGFITCIAVARPVLYISYAGYGMAHIFKSTDEGVHWSNANGVLPTDALPDVPVSALVINQQNSEVVYASTDIGVFRTRDAGDSWEPFDDGMPRIVVSGLALRRNTRTLYASTMGRGVYRRPL